MTMRTLKCRTCAYYNPNNAAIPAGVEAGLEGYCHFNPPTVLCWNTIDHSVDIITQRPQVRAKDVACASHKG